jgi:hypothetical protein
VPIAILAASPHNTQPWLFKITNSSIELHIDTQRNVGALDPYLREEHIGMGCALENLMLAAPANGYAATAALLPGKLGRIPAEPKPQLLARVNLTPGKSEENELYNAIPRRHTNRGPSSMAANVGSARNGIRSSNTAMASRLMPSACLP